jgi:hypothetical protein
MPTYTNNGSGRFDGIPRIGGGTQSLNPGESITTYEFLDLSKYSGVVKDSDTPVYAPVTKFTTVTFSAAEQQTVTLTQSDINTTKKIVIQATGAGMIIDVRVNASDGVIQRKMIVDDMMTEVIIEANKDIRLVYLTSNQAGTAYVYLEQD